MSVKNETLEIMKEMLEVQRNSVKKDDEYTVGLFNGMEYMVALAEKREPKFIHVKRFEINGGNE